MNVLAAKIFENVHKLKQNHLLKTAGKKQIAVRKISNSKVCNSTQR
jgi:hypothetical protein